MARMTDPPLLDDIFHIKGLKKQQEEEEICDDAIRRDDEEDSISPRHLSKLVLPPLGMSSGHLECQNGKEGRVISPMTSRYRLWETVMVLLVFYSAWLYPFEVAFTRSSRKTALFVIDNVVDCFFAVDIVLTFFVAYVDPITQLLVYNRKRIATRAIERACIL